jgi:heat shock protein HtpX
MDHVPAGGRPHDAVASTQRGRESAVFKRILLFMLTNLAIMVSITIVIEIVQATTGVRLDGRTYEGALFLCLAWGMGGAFISLGLSRIMAKWSMGVQLVNGQTGDGTLDWLYHTVDRQARAAGLPNTPEVGVYDSPELNAFATGPTKSRSLVAVSTGLLRSMRRDEVEAVLGHEIAHVANGDMVTLTLVQGVVNAVVMFLARIVSWAVGTAMGSRSNDGEGGYSWGAAFAARIVLEIVLGVFGMMVVGWFSRQREFRADQGGAQLAGKGAMVAALQRLGRMDEVQDDRAPALAAFKISGGRGGLMALLSTHPPIAERIARLERGHA